MRVALSAQVSLYVALVAVVGVAVGLGAGAAGVLRPYTAFRVFAASLVLGGLVAMASGALGLWTTRGGEAGGRGRALGGLAIGAALLGLAIGSVLPHRAAPPIHDLTTDPEDPPSFRVAAQHPDNRGRDLTYPHGGAEVTATQRRAYPDLAPLALELPPGEAFELAERTARELGWTLTWSNAQLGLIEASETSRWFRFVDDVVIRIRPRDDGGPGSVIDLRSTSRVGVSDLGANARRIRSYLAALRTRAAGP